MTNAHLADVARRWVFAEAERKLRKKERAYANVIASRNGVERRYDPFKDCFAWPNVTAEQKPHVDRCHRAQAAYREAASRAQGLRSALSKAAKPLGVPAPDPEINALYDELCAREAAENMREMLGQRDE